MTEKLNYTALMMQRKIAYEPVSQELRELINENAKNVKEALEYIEALEKEGDEGVDYV